MRGKLTNFDENHKATILNQTQNCETEEWLFHCVERDNLANGANLETSLGLLQGNFDGDHPCSSPREQHAAPMEA